MNCCLKIKVGMYLFSLFFRWFKIEGVGLRQVLPSPKIKHHLEVLILQELLVEDSGIYVCIMNNTAGAERIEVNLTVRSWLDTLVTPSHQTIGKKIKISPYFSRFPCYF